MTAPITFEESMKNLEATVRALEASDISLEQALAAFETGMQHARTCEQQLAHAKGKVEVLLKQASGDLSCEPFTAAEPT